MGGDVSSFSNLKVDPHTRPLQPDPRCTDCLAKLSDDVIHMVGGKAVSFQDQIVSVTQKKLADFERGGWASPEIANDILRVIRRVSGVDDPYEKVKTLEMAQAKKVYEQVKGHVGDDLRSLTNLALLGNSFDFFRSTDDALAGVIENAGKKLVYFHDDLHRLAHFLSNDPGLILYLTDNAGEVFFDLPLFKYIRNLARRTILVVKGGPGLNDLTGEELKSFEEFGETTDTGTDGAGIDWRHVSPGFAALVEQADLIIAKGMANFETVYFRETPTPVFFLFRTKCRVVTDYFNAPMDSMMALWKEGRSLTAEAGELNE